MTTEAQERTCSTCCAYEGGECMNLVSFIRSPGAHAEQPYPTDTCSDHVTVDEDRREDAALNKFRGLIGLPPLDLK